MTERTFPEPVPTGTETYYRDRVADFCRRHPCAHHPSYYLDFGDKCLHQFLATKPELTTDGQQWLETTLRLLQEAIEDKRGADPEVFDRLECDDQAFHDFAFSTHADAYIKAGVFTLPASDLWRILRTPDMTDVVSPDGVGEILELLGKLDRDDVGEIADATADEATPDEAQGVLAWMGNLIGRLRR